MYTHIFDYFDANGKYIGGCEPLSDSTDKPTINHGTYSIPAYVIYIGWCNEDDKVYSGCYFPDSTDYNPETKQLIPLYEHNDTIFGKVCKVSKYGPRDMTLERCCGIKGIELPERYIKYKEEQQKKFLEEYQKCKDDIEYFKNTYYRIVKKS